MNLLELDGPDGGRLAVRDLGGRGPDVLFVHGAGLVGEVFAPFAAELGPAHSLALDLRGHGKSSAPADGRFSWQGFTEDVLAAIDGLGLEHPIGIGHSLGASALLLAEARRPGAFARLYCYEPIVVLPDLDLTRAVGHLAQVARRRTARFASREEALERFRSGPLGSWSEESLRAYVRGGFREDGGGITLCCSGEDEARAYEAALESHLFDDLGAIACPVTLAYGTASVGPVRQAVPAIIAALPDVREVAFEGLGHFGPMEDPQRLAASVMHVSEVPEA